MGIRVRKHLGYGILDLKPDDPRWDIEAPWDREGRLSDFLAWMGEPEAGEKILDMAAYEGWGLGRERGQMFTETTEFFLLKEALKDRIEKERGASVSKSFHHDDEFGKGGVVLFQCPQHADWSRHDNIIDYYEEPPEGRVTLLEGRTGIWPYDGTMKRCREPSPEVAAKLSEATPRMQAFAYKSMRELDGAEISILGGGEYNQLTGFWAKTLPAYLKDPEVIDHMKRDWRPRVPVGVLALMEYMGCFPNPTSPDSMLNSLRPMVYVYWC